MTVVRLLIAISAIGLGVACIFATDAVWALVERFNQRIGKQVTRTDDWDARASLAGVILIGVGVVFIVTATLTA